MELPAQLDGDLWTAMQAQLRRALGQTTYEIWLAALRPVSWDGNVLTLSAPSETYAWVLRRYGRLLNSCASALFGSPAEVRLESAPAAPHSRGRTAFRAATTAPPDGERREHILSRRPPPSLNPRYSFEQFIIGEGNRLAHAAALSVAEYPGQAYNPLFLHAPPGLGKTHLLHAIGNYIIAFGGGTRVRYTTVETFTNHFLGALGSRTTDAFKQAYRDVDVLLIDDVQFLASKAKTEEEFFHTFNALYETGRQLVLTCDRLPSELAGIEQRLRERFEAGLVADITAPDLPTRTAILRKRAALDRIELPDPAVLEQIAERVTENIRTLEGALIRVVAYHSLTGRAIDGDLVATVLDSLYPSAPCGGAEPLGIPRIIDTVAKEFSLDPAALMSPSRAAKVSWPRQLAMYLCRELTKASLPAIGRAFGGRNHATVLHACRRVGERLHGDAQLAEDLRRLRRELLGQQPDRRC